jgi:hypothetical protein
MTIQHVTSSFCGCWWSCLPTTPHGYRLYEPRLRSNPALNVLVIAQTRGAFKNQTTGTLCDEQARNARCAQRYSLALLGNLPQTRLARLRHEVMRHLSRSARYLLCVRLPRLHVHVVGCCVAVLLKSTVQYNRMEWQPCFHTLCRVIPHCDNSRRR